MENLVERNVKVIYYKKFNCLHVHLSGFITYDELVRVLQYEFQMIEYYKLKKCVVDLTEIKVYPPGGKEYIQNVWFPNMEDNGMQYIAFIVPKNIFGEASMKKVHLVENKKLQIRNFRDEQTAFAWIQQVSVN